MPATHREDDSKCVAKHKNITVAPFECNYERYKKDTFMKDT